jgi:hypothetical protein
LFTKNALIALTAGFLFSFPICISSFSNTSDGNQTKLSEADLHFGAMQVSQLVLDRPDLENCLTQYPKVRRWLEESFAGGRNGARIHWDYSSTLSGREGEYVPGSAYAPTLIRITDRRDLTGLDRLAVLIFEVYNSESRAVCLDAADKARRGEIDRERFVIKSVEAEYNAVVKCKAFLIEHSIPADGNRYVASSLNIAPNFEAFYEFMKRARGLDYFYASFDYLVASLPKAAK